MTEPKETEDIVGHPDLLSVLFLVAIAACLVLIAVGVVQGEFSDVWQNGATP
ncbi:MAG: hypothetical protein JRF63_06680 [Deltaproteobacteria bacterium]|nr:hypothetical protein [Deltaproteobacteria bacterium]